MTHYTPLRDHRHGHAHLSPQVLRLDDGRRIYRRRRQTWHWWVADITFRYVLPFLVLVLAAAVFVGLFWIAVAIERAVRSVTGS